MALKLKTAPGTTPVSIAEIKQHCRGADFTDDDAILQRHLDDVVNGLDGYSGIMGRCLITQVWELYYDAFPCGDLKIPLGDLISVDAVDYIDPTSGLYVTWNSSNYEVDTKSLDGWVVPVDGWPTPMDTINAVRVTFTAGYGAAAAVPGRIKSAIILEVKDLYEGKYDKPPTEFQNLRQRIKDLLAPHRRIAM